MSLEELRARALFVTSQWDDPEGRIALKRWINSTSREALEGFLTIAPAPHPRLVALISDDDEHDNFTNN